MRKSIEQKKFHSDREIKLLLEYNKALEEQNRIRLEQKKLLENQIYRLSTVIKQSAAMESYADQLKLDNNQNLKSKPIYDSNTFLPQYFKKYNELVNVSSEAVTYSNNNSSILNQLVILKSKYESALFENTQLIQKIQIKSQQMNRLLKQQKQRYRNLQDQLEKATIQYHNHLTNLNNNIIQLQHHLQNKDNVQKKNYYLQNQIQKVEAHNRQLIYQINQMQNKLHSLSLELKSYKIKQQQYINRRPHTIQFNNHHPLPQNYPFLNNQYKNTHEINLLMQKIKDYDKRIQILQEANKNLQVQLKQTIEQKTKVKSNGSKKELLQTQVSQLRHQINSLKSLNYNQPSKLGYNKLHLQNQQVKNYKRQPIIQSSQQTVTFIKSPRASYQVKIPQNTNDINRYFPSTTINKNIKHILNKQDLQLRIGELQQENINIKKQLYYNH